ncbi:MAG TPA: polyphosphate kinase 1 [Candidatus Scatosoma pullistercoris]|uniref:Polyphosphate kinase n=1 Tax=Candidatus Scatosoma pullistercoris TaxID=2840934 RepID=A0A9D1MEJ5_9FIRM|nr:polyphosphate kinase 1 [Candidatus Scatosoma pullistercoris]
MRKVTKDSFVKGIYCNREYSWLQFNRRVLDQANDLTNPLLERCKFLGIFCSNLDEFFMVRVGSLLNESKLDPTARENKTDLTAEEQVEGILDVVKGLYKESSATYSRLKAELSRNGMRILRPYELTVRQRLHCEAHFLEFILPLLSPMVLDAKHPMIRFENKHLYMMFELEKEGREMFGVMAIPTAADRLFRIEGGKKINLIALEDLVSEFGHYAFPGYEVKGKTMLRVTRNADFDTEVDDADLEHDFDFSKYMKRQVGMRPMLDAVRLEIDKNSDRLRSFVLRNLDLKKSYCFKAEHYLDYKFLFSLGKYFPEEKLPILRYPPFRGRVAADLQPPASLIERVREKDIFLSYPFDSMDPLIRLLNECAEDKRVVSIKITIYRLDNHSRIVEALKRASENGKEVTVVIELCARFDEENNMYFAGVLQEAGCTIIYGMQNYKVHSKIVSVLLSEDGEIGYITHLGTGNYNESTAKQYTDLNILTADREIGEDAAAFFRNVAICNTDFRYEKLLIAPQGLKKGLLKCIDEQIERAKEGKPARIVAKMNSLTDKQMIDRLYEAGKSGVKISMIVRGICCLLPGIPGETDNIRIISIVGRFLEHSRIYCFGEGEERKMYISSADLMTRNTDRRVEIATPVLDKSIEEKIYRMLTVMLADNIKARVFLPDGGYKKTEQVGERIDSQNVFLSGI